MLKQADLCSQFNKNMEIKLLNLLELIQNTQAFYSTEYSGEYRVPADLLENLLENSQTKEPTFDGVIFLQKINEESYIVVDGMKRLITLSLLLHAICECYKLTSDKNTKAIDLVKKRYLFGNYGTKIQLNDYEKNIYEKLLNYERMTLEEKQHPMFRMLHEFWAKIKMNNLSAVRLFNHIKQIKALVCIYDECKIENRDLYQFLNCNNGYIDELRLINNFIEEKTGEQAVLWYEIIDMFKKADMVRKIKYFFLDFLTIQKNGIIPKENEIYMSFKRFYLRMLNAGQTIDDFFKNVKRIAEIYIKLSTANFENKEIQQRIQTIKDNNMYETFPYLLEVTDDYLNKRITEETLSQLLDTLILFVAEQKSGNFESMVNFANLSHEINRRIT
ncbi:hypothetical protein IJ707_02350 [bacterium]|nr:hypothetical protein [bacterium]